LSHFNVFNVLNYSFNWHWWGTRRPTRSCLLCAYIHTRELRFWLSLIEHAVVAVICSIDGVIQTSCITATRAARGLYDTVRRVDSSHSISSRQS